MFDNRMEILFSVLVVVVSVFKVVVLIVGNCVFNCLVVCVVFSKVFGLLICGGWMFFVLCNMVSICLVWFVYFLLLVLVLSRVIVCEVVIVWVCRFLMIVLFFFYGF